MEEALTFNADIKYFAGLLPDEHGIDHSTLSRFRARVGARRFARLFNRVVAAAREVGVVADQLHAIDARAGKANVATWDRIDRELAACDDDDLPPAGFVNFEGPQRGSLDIPTPGGAGRAGAAASTATSTTSAWMPTLGW